MPTENNVIILWSLWFWETAYKWNRQTYIRYNNFVYETSINWTHHMCFAYLYTTAIHELLFPILFLKRIEIKDELIWMNIRDIGILCIFIFSSLSLSIVCTTKHTSHQYFYEKWRAQRREFVVFTRIIHHVRYGFFSSSIIFFAHVEL